MNKRIYIILFLSLVISVPLFSAEIEIKAGIQMLSMKDYDDKIAQINKTLLLDGATAKNDKTTGAIGIDISYGHKFTEFLRLGPRIKVVPGVAFTANYLYPNGIKYTDYTSSVLLLFTGGGAEYNFMFGDKFGIFAGLDMGYQFGFGTNKIISYSTTGDVIDTKNTSVSTNGFGYYVRGGAKYYFTPDFGLLLELNYNNIGENVYIGSGLCFSLFEKAKASSSDYINIIKTANSLFMAKEYAKATTYYMNALKIKKEAVVYKYLGHSFFYLKQFAKARWCYERAVEISGDIQLKAMIDKIKGMGY